MTNENLRVENENLRKELKEKDIIIESLLKQIKYLNIENIKLQNEDEELKQNNKLHNKEGINENIDFLDNQNKQYNIDELANAYAEEMEIIY